MPGIGAILAGVGTALGGAASAGSAIASGSLNRKNRKWQEKMYNLQVTQRREDAQAQYERTKDYAQWAWNRFESPTAQRAAMEAAGMNPFVEGSVIQPMGTPRVMFRRPKVVPSPLKVRTRITRCLTLWQVPRLFVRPQCKVFRLKIFRHRLSILTPSV